MHVKRSHCHTQSIVIPSPLLQSPRIAPRCTTWTLFPSIALLWGLQMACQSSADDPPQLSSNNKVQRRKPGHCCSLAFEMATPNPTSELSLGLDGGWVIHLDGQVNSKVQRQNLGSCYSLEESEDTREPVRSAGLGNGSKKAREPPNDLSPKTV